jgi:TfoX/Sxy family transcriptional regulator of competence genes
VGSNNRDADAASHILGRMAYSEELADRIRAELASRSDVVEKKMFGGIAFMVAGSMAVGIIGKDLMARVGRDNYERALARPYAGVMTFTGRPLSGFVLVRAKGISTRATLKKWIDEAVAFARTLPKKKKKKKKAKMAQSRHGLARR